MHNVVNEIGTFELLLIVLLVNTDTHSFIVRLIVH